MRLVAARRSTFASARRNHERAARHASATCRGPGAPRAPRRGADHPARPSTRASSTTPSSSARVAAEPNAPALARHHPVDHRPARPRRRPELPGRELARQARRHLDERAVAHRRPLRSCRARVKQARWPSRSSSITRALRGPWAPTTYYPPPSLELRAVRSSWVAALGSPSLASWVPPARGVVPRRVAPLVGAAFAGVGAIVRQGCPPRGGIARHFFVQFAHRVDGRRAYRPRVGARTNRARRPPPLAERVERRPVGRPPSSSRPPSALPPAAVASRASPPGPRDGRRVPRRRGRPVRGAARSTPPPTRCSTPAREAEHFRGAARGRWEVTGARANAFLDDVRSAAGVVAAAEQVHHAASRRPLGASSRSSSRRSRGCWGPRAGRFADDAARPGARRPCARAVLGALGALDALSATRAAGLQRLAGLSLVEGTRGAPDAPIELRGVTVRLRRSRRARRRERHGPPRGVTTAVGPNGATRIPPSRGCSRGRSGPTRAAAPGRGRARQTSRQGGWRSSPQARASSRSLSVLDNVRAAP